MIESLFAGLLTGGIYALLALAYSIIFTTTRVVNFALGEVIMVAAMVTYSALAFWGMPIITALIVGCAIAVLLNLIIKAAALSRLQRLDPITALLVTLAFGLLIVTIAQLVWGTGGAKFPEVFGRVKLFNLGSLAVTSQDIATIVIVAAALIITDAIQRKTILGKSMQAAAEDVDACGVVGLNVGRINAISFTLAAVLCTVAALLLAPIAGANVRLGTMVGLKGFASGILGGLTKSRSAIFGGLIFGMGESLAGYIFGGESKEIVIFVLLMIILGFKPTGLWGETQWKRLA
jgi:branched-chain amino acid transport system permease protein